MTRDETKRAAEQISSLGDEWYDPMCVQVASAFLAQCERVEEVTLPALENCVRWMIEQGCSHEYAVLIDAKAAIKAIEEGR